MFALIERLIAFLVFLSLARTVINLLMRIFRGGGARPRIDIKAKWRTAAGQSGAAATDAGGPSESTILHQDPVCGTYVAPTSSLKRIVNGKVLHFCSEKCRDEYRV